MIHPILLLMPLVNCQKVGYNGLNLTKKLGGREDEGLQSRIYEGYR